MNIPFLWNYDKNGKMATIVHSTDINRTTDPLPAWLETVVASRPTNRQIYKQCLVDMEPLTHQEVNIGYHFVAGDINKGQYKTRIGVVVFDNQGQPLVGRGQHKTVIDRSTDTKHVVHYHDGLFSPNNARVYIPPSSTSIWTVGFIDNDLLLCHHVFMQPFSTTTDIFFYNKNQAFYELSNFFVSPFYVKGVLVHSVEQYYQASKFENAAYRQLIMVADTPGKVYCLGKQHKPGYNWTLTKNPQDTRTINRLIDEYKQVRIRPDWLAVRDQVMVSAIFAKFTQVPRCVNALQQTGTFAIREDTHRDLYWGDGHGHGENKLGKLLVQVREQTVYNDSTVCDIHTHIQENQLELSDVLATISALCLNKWGFVIVFHLHAPHMTFEYMTHKDAFDMKEDDYWNYIFEHILW